MTRIIPLLLIAAVCAWAAGPAEAAAVQPVAGADCHLKRYGGVDFIVGPQQLVLIPVTVGEKPGFMILNTASAISVVWDDIVHDYGLAVQNMPDRVEVDYEGERIKRYALTRTFAVGDMRIGSARFMLATHPADAASVSGAAPIVGTIGMDLFANVDIELDFRNKRLSLFAQDHCPGPVVYWADVYGSVPLRRGVLGNVYFPIELDGKKIEAALATTRAYSSLHTEVTRRIYGFDESQSDVTTAADSSRHTPSHLRAMSLTTKGLKVTQSQIELLPRSSGCRLNTANRQDGAAEYTDCTGAEPPLLLGMNVLEKLHLYIATKENVLYFTAADAGLGTRPGSEGPTAP